MWLSLQKDEAKLTLRFCNAPEQRWFLSPETLRHGCICPTDNVINILYILSSTATQYQLVLSIWNLKGMENWEND